MKKIILFFLSLLFVPCMAQEPNQNMVNAAKEGNAQAQNDLGLFYISNNREEEALYWWKKSADQDNVMAQSNLGEYYSRKQEYKKALQWIVPAAEKGDFKALYRLGIDYYNGWAVDKDEDKAFQYLLASAKGNVAPACLMVANMYENKYNDRLNAAVWYRRAADYGDVEAQNWIGCEELKVGNTENGVRYLTQAAKLGLAKAQFNLGVFYFNQKQFNTARTWLEKSANQGYKSAVELLQRYEFR